MPRVAASFLRARCLQTASDGALLYLRYQALEEHREEMGANCRYAEALASLALPALHGLFPGAAAAAGAKDALLC